MELDKHYEAKECEKRWLSYWLKEKLYRFDPDSKAEVYSVDTPPPTVSGVMHMGHAFSYAQQDFIVRFQRMRGKNIFYPWGFDDNGLATERYVEKKCNVKATKMDRQEFIKLCLKETKEVEEKLKQDWGSLGLSPEWDRNYRTIDEWARKTSQRSFIDLYNQGREYRKEAPTIWCPRCETAIAQVELQDKELSSHFSDIVFKMENGDDIIIATTRPELLPSCVAVFVHPDDSRYKDLVGKKAKVPLFEQEVPIIADKKVDMEKGTGIVMCCTFGDLMDIDWWYAHKLPLRVSITKDGRMNDLAEKYEGMPIKDARKEIIDDLKGSKLLVKQEDITHSVNVHERCGTDIEFLVTKQWFIKYLDLKDDFIKAGRKIKWYPDHMRVRYEHWIQGLQWDWCISRQRYFGVPFPVWYCCKCGEVVLADDTQLPVDPLKDKPKDKCKCGSDIFEPEKDVLDTWATSSLTPEIALKWREDKKFFSKMFPMSLRPQAHDIITFWAFNTVVKAWLHEKKVPWKDIMISGHALDPKGKKMSKSKGNAIDPMKMMENYSADCLRFWAAGSKLGDDLPFMEKDLVTGKKFITKMWNASRFVLMHLEGFQGEKPKELHPLDRWLLSKLNTIVKVATETFERYEYSRTKAEVEKFFWQVFCDNYLELVKDRLYNQDDYGDDAVISAKYTLSHSLLTMLKLFAPITPFFTEGIYQVYFAGFEGKKSIHISGWPEHDKKLHDENAEKTGDLVVAMTSAVRKAKSEKSLSLNAPVKKLTIEADEKALKPVLKDIQAITKAEKIEFGEAEMEIGEGLKITISL
ncbi:MAG: valine--tRNA ligase [Nanoarchaeota archaeon]|nr:valine--tRNA ligase [Nanoarchaeota archaeon]